MYYSYMDVSMSSCVHTNTNLREIRGSLDHIFVTPPACLVPQTRKDLYHRRRRLQEILTARGSSPGGIAPAAANAVETTGTDCARAPRFSALLPSPALHVCADMSDAYSLLPHLLLN